VAAQVDVPGVERVVSRYQAAARPRISTPRTEQMRAALASGARRVAHAEAEGRTSWAEGQVVRSLHRTYTWQALAEATGLSAHRLRQIADLWPEEAA